MNRLVRLLFEVFGLALILIVVGLGVLVARLAQGPLVLNDIVTDAETFLSDLSPGLDFKIGSAQLELHEQYRNVRVRLSGVRVVNTDGRSVGALKDMVLAYNWRNIVGFSVVPVALEINRPTVDITRFNNDHVGFNLHEPDEPQDEAEQVAPAISVDEVVAFLKRAPHALRHIRISDATIRYHNIPRDYNLYAANGLFDFHRIRGDIDGTMSMDVTATEFTHRVQGQIAYDHDTDHTDVSLAVKDVMLDHLRVITPDIPEDLQFSMPMSLLVTASIDRSMQWQKADIVLTGTKGALLFPPHLTGTVTLSDLAIHAVYEPVAKKMTVENLVTKIGRSSLTVSGMVDFSKDDLHIEAKAATQNVPVDRLRLYWPVGLGDNARDWVTQRIQDGVANAASVDVAVTIPADKAQDPIVEKLGGKIEFTDVTVDYLTPMPVVKHINGHVTFDHENFDIVAQDGKLFDTTVKQGKVRISKLLEDHPEIDIALRIEGPIKDAMTTISSEPLKYAQRMGMKPDQFSGDSEMDLSLHFPLLSDLELEQVEMSATAALKNIGVRSILKDLSVSSSLLNLDIDTKSMKVTGDATVNGAPATIEWNEYFTDEAENTTTIQATGKATPAILRGLRLPIDRYFTGAAHATVDLRQAQDKTVFVNVDANLAGMGIAVPEFGLQKSAASSGNASLQIVSDIAGVTTISDASVSWPNVFVQNGMLRFNAQQELESATLKNIRADRTRADIVIAPDGRGRSRVVIRGDVVDAAAFWSYRSPIDPQKNKSASQPMILSIRANTLYLNKDVPLHGVKGDLELKGAELLSGTLSATAPENATLNLTQIIQADRTRQLTLQATNAGMIFNALDLVNDVRGGTLMVDGISTTDSPDVIKGVATLSQFTLVKAPVLARLLNAFSLRGLHGLLNSNGLTFSKLQSGFTLSDPQTIRLSKGKMAGASLGLSFSGTIHRDTQTLDLKGTIVPLDGINKFFGRIPLVGQILTGVNGDGLIGATYTVKGSSSEPTISINPLSALTPGIFRSILFE